MTTNDGTLELRVQFGNVSIGDGTARLGIKLSRTHIDLSECDRLLCGRRLTGEVVTGPAGDDPDQRYLADGMRYEVRAVFDVKRFGVGPKDITAGLTFGLQDVDVEALSHFAKREGVLRVESVADLGDEDGEDGETFGTDDDAESDGETDPDEDLDLSDQGLLPDGIQMGHESAAKEANPTGWRKRSVTELGLTDRRLTLLRNAGLKTLGHIQDFCSEHGDWWHTKVGGGFTKGDRQAVEDGFLAFWEAHPEFCEAPTA